MDLSNENVIHVVKGDVEYLQFRRLLEYEDKIKHLYTLGLNRNFRTSKVVGNIDNKDYDKAISDYRVYSKEILGDVNQVVKPIQKHTNVVKKVCGKVNVDGPDISVKDYDFVDGLVTDKSDIILSTTNADCILMLFYDPVKNVIANSHSGWKGTLQRICVNTVNMMVNDYGSDVNDIICCICPSIRKCHFEVERDVRDLFVNEFSDLLNKDFCDNFIDINNNDIITETVKDLKWNIDTVLINKIVLRNLGLKDSNIIDSGICSVCSSDLIHSYRVEKASFGLNTAMIKKV